LVRTEGFERELLSQLLLGARPAGLRLLTLPKVK
jgi:hypothetical protein